MFDHLQIGHHDSGTLPNIEPAWERTNEEDLDAVMQSQMALSK